MDPLQVRASVTVQILTLDYVLAWVGGAHEPRAIASSSPIQVKGGTENIYSGGAGTAKRRGHHTREDRKCGEMRKGNHRRRRPGPTKGERKSGGEARIWQKYTAGQEPLRMGTIG
jgi:hypothetical protein